ncbi:hypothetical protein HNY73_009751 [Argiope bruennichi]|uniref:Uncharacterized protein n=1 Tax=Argiope bruennichi TaxID=94029 RepID=A0A8T0FFZ7_ARGBR|nr:hypothetical protein HNY73_009751 [Argiope bruennichi]
MYESSDRYPNPLVAPHPHPSPQVPRRNMEADENSEYRAKMVMRTGYNVTGEMQFSFPPFYIVERLLLAATAANNSISAGFETVVASNMNDFRFPLSLQALRIT